MRKLLSVMSLWDLETEIVRLEVCMRKEYRMAKTHRMPQVAVIFHTKATNYRALLRKKSQKIWHTVGLCHPVVRLHVSSACACACTCLCACVCVRVRVCVCVCVRLEVSMRKEYVDLMSQWDQCHHTWIRLNPSQGMHFIETQGNATEIPVAVCDGKNWRMSHVTYDCAMSCMNLPCHVWMSHVTYDCACGWGRECPPFSVAKTQRIPYLYRSLSTKVTYI